MRACWLKWVGRDWSISADYIWLNYSGANISSLADRMYLYEDHFRTLINSSDKHGRSSKHGAAEVERCFDSMNGSEKVSSETSLGCSTIEQKAIDSG